MLAELYRNAGLSQTAIRFLSRNTHTPSCEARNATCHQIRDWVFPEVGKHATNSACARIDPEEVETEEVSVTKGKELQMLIEYGAVSTTRSGPIGHRATGRWHQRLSCEPSNMRQG